MFSTPKSIGEEIVCPHCFWDEKFASEFDLEWHTLVFHGKSTFVALATSDKKESYSQRMSRIVNEESALKRLSRRNTLQYNQASFRLYPLDFGADLKEKSVYRKKDGDGKSAGGVQDHNDKQGRCERCNVCKQSYFKDVGHKCKCSKAKAKQVEKKEKVEICQDFKVGASSCLLYDKEHDSDDAPNQHRCMRKNEDCFVEMSAEKEKLAVSKERERRNRGCARMGTREFDTFQESSEMKENGEKSEDQEKCHCKEQPWVQNEPEEQISSIKDISVLMREEANVTASKESEEKESKVITASVLNNFQEKDGLENDDRKSENQENVHSKKQHGLQKEEDKNTTEEIGSKSHCREKVKMSQQTLEKQDVNDENISQRVEVSQRDDKFKNYPNEYDSSQDKQNNHKLKKNGDQHIVKQAGEYCINARDISIHITESAQTGKDNNDMGHDKDINEMKEKINEISERYNKANIHLSAEMQNKGERLEKSEDKCKDMQNINEELMKKLKAAYIDGEEMGSSLKYLKTSYDEVTDELEQQKCMNKQIKMQTLRLKEEQDALENVCAQREDDLEEMREIVKAKDTKLAQEKELIATLEELTATKQTLINDMMKDCQVKKELDVCGIDHTRERATDFLKSSSKKGKSQQMRLALMCLGRNNGDDEKGKKKQSKKEFVRILVNDLAEENNNLKEMFSEQRQCSDLLEKVLSEKENEIESLREEKCKNAERFEVVRKKGEDSLKRLLVNNKRREEENKQNEKCLALSKDSNAFLTKACTKHTKQLSELKKENESLKKDIQFEKSYNTEIERKFTEYFWKIEGKRGNEKKNMGSLEKQIHLLKTELEKSSKMLSKEKESKALIEKRCKHIEKEHLKCKDINNMIERKTYSEDGTQKLMQRINNLEFSHAITNLGNQVTQLMHNQNENGEQNSKRVDPLYSEQTLISNLGCSNCVKVSQTKSLEEQTSDLTVQDLELSDESTNYESKYKCLNEENQPQLVSKIRMLQNKIACLESKNEELMKKNKDFVMNQNKCLQGNSILEEYKEKNGDLEKENKVLQDRITKLREEMRKLKELKGNKDGNRDRTSESEELEVMKSENMKLKISTGNLTEKISELERESALKRQTVTIAENKKAATEENNRDNEMRGLRHEIEQLTENIAVLKEEISKAEEEMIKRDNENEQMQRAKNMLETENKTLKDKIKEIQKDHEVVENRRKVMEEENKRIKEEGLNIQEEQRRIEQESQRIENEKREMQEECKRVEEEYVVIQEEQGRIEQESQRIQNEKINLQKECKKVEEEKIKFQNKNKLFDKMKINFEEERRKMREKIESFQQTSNCLQSKKEIACLQEELANAKRQLMEEKMKLSKQMKEDKETSKAELDATIKEFNSLVARNKSLLEFEKECQTKNAKLEDEIKETKVKERNSMTKMTKMINEIATMEMDKNELSILLGNSNARVENLEMKLKCWNEKKRDRETALEEMVHSLEEENESLEEKIKRLEHDERIIKQHMNMTLDDTQSAPQIPLQNTQYGDWQPMQQRFCDESDFFPNSGDDQTDHVDNIKQPGDIAYTIGAGNAKQINGNMYTMQAFVNAGIVSEPQRKDTQLDRGLQGMKFTYEDSDENSEASCSPGMVSRQADNYFSRTTINFPSPTPNLSTSFPSPSLNEGSLSPMLQRPNTGFSAGLKKSGKKNKKGTKKAKKATQGEFSPPPLGSAQKKKFQEPNEQTQLKRNSPLTLLPRDTSCLLGKKTGIFGAFPICDVPKKKTLAFLEPLV